MKTKLALATLLSSLAMATSAASAAQPQPQPENSHGGLGLADGVAENTNPDRIAAIEEQARQLEAKQIDNFEAPAAGKRHTKHGHKHGAKTGKPPVEPAASGPVQ